VRRRPSLTATFAVVSLLAFAVLGVVLVAAVSNLLRSQALDTATRMATAYVDSGISDRVTLTEWSKDRLVADTVERLATNLRPDSTLLAVRMWSVNGTSMYDTTGQQHPFADSQRLHSALVDRQPSSALATQLAPSSLDPTGTPHLTTVMDVYVPVVPEAGDTPVGVAEVALDYTSTEHALSDAVRTVAVIVALGLLTVWLLLFRTVHGASRKLRSTSDENARLALLDPLTGLPNRRLLAERLEDAVEDAQQSGAHVGLLLLDVDRFKDINDSLGHDRGDQLLVQVADRLRTIVRDTDTVARLGGDEFAVLLRTVRSVDDAGIFAQRVLGVFADPFEIDGLVLHVETSIGLALLPDHADDAQNLMKRADVAMYVAKAGRRGMCVYEPDGDANSPARLILLGDLRRALDCDDQLSVHYQPKLDLNSREIVGLEALLRWNHPMRGFIPPGEFIPLAEQTGLVHLITRRVLELVLAQQRIWIDQGWEVQVAVNLSALNLAEPDLDQHISELLQEYGVPPRLLEFEITESAIVQDPERAAQTLARIAAMGSTIALDDFGIGNTSISQLRDLPIDTLKIDRSFILDMTGGNEVLVKVVTDLAHEFQMVAVAEGVEEPLVAERLRAIGCDLAQGYLYARPVPADQLPAIFESFGTDPRRAATTTVVTT
jgi:diguanylate cyclase (GGDEF)-like protein